MLCSIIICFKCVFIAVHGSLEFYYWVLFMSVKLFEQKKNKSGYTQLVNKMFVGTYIVCF